MDVETRKQQLRDTTEVFEFIKAKEGNFKQDRNYQSKFKFTTFAVIAAANIIILAAY